MTIEELLADQRLNGPLPPAPPWHVDTDACRYGWVECGTKPVWLLCDCEDPANPWPARTPGDGPRDCGCFGCRDHSPRWERGRLASCEYKDHHCDDCHDHGRCTVPECERPEFITAVAVRYHDTVYSLLPPARHHDVFAILPDLPLEATALRNQGFVTNRGRFVDRADAAVIARAAGQLIREPTPSNMLTSEDVW